LKEAAGCSGKTLKYNETTTPNKANDDDTNGKTHVRKNVEDFGRLLARREGTPVGWFTRPGKDAIIPDANATTR